MELSGFKIKTPAASGRFCCGREHAIWTWPVAYLWSGSRLLPGYRAYQRHRTNLFSKTQTIYTIFFKISIIIFKNLQHQKYPRYLYESAALDVPIQRPIYNGVNNAAPNH